MTGGRPRLGHYVVIIVRPRGRTLVADASSDQAAQRIAWSEIEKGNVPYIANMRSELFVDLDPTLATTTSAQRMSEPPTPPREDTPAAAQQTNGDSR